MDYDLVIVGGGPAGICAGIYAIRRGVKTLIIEKGLVGGQIILAPEIGNYPGFENISGSELAARMEAHARESGVDFISSEVLRIEVSGDVKKVSTSDNVYDAKAVIIASGAVHRHLDVAGEEEFSGKGVSYCATCDGPLFKGKTVAVIGGGNHACEDAGYLADVAEKVYLIHRRDEFRAEECRVDFIGGKGVEFIFDSKVVEFRGDKTLTRVKLENVKTKKVSELPVDGVFVSIGVVPLHALAGEMGVIVDDMGYIQVDERQMTNIEGVFAAGDVTGGIMQISTAVGEGCTASLSAYEYIKRPYWGKTK